MLKLLFIFALVKDLDRFYDRSDAVLDTELATVDAEIIALGCSPFLVGVVVIVACPALIGLGDHVLGFFWRFVVFGCKTVDPPVKICMYKYTKAVLPAHNLHSGLP